MRGVEFRGGIKPITRMGNLPQICDEGKLKNGSPQTESPEPQAATGGGGDNRASLAKQSVLKGGFGVGWDEKIGSVLRLWSTVIELDEERRRVGGIC